MSLEVALNSAVSSLLVLEQQMAVTSDNISNAGTTGYTEKTVSTAAEYTAGTGTGVLSLGTSTYIDTYLATQIQNETSDSSLATTLSDYFSQLQQVMGDVSSGSTTTAGSDISSDLTTLSTDLNSLSDDPSDSSLKTQVVEDVSQFADDLRSLSSQIQSLRQQAEDQVSTEVTTANSTLDTIATLNKEIATATAAGQSTADLQDQRQTALNTLSGILGINTFTNSAGEVQIYTKSGQPLLTGDTVTPLIHTEASGISASTTYPDGGIGGITVAGHDITDSLVSGTLAGLVTIRDTTLTNVQSELDTLASSVSSTLNTITNQGSSSPPPQTLTGTGVFSSSSSVTVASGTTIQVAVTDSSGDITSLVDVDISGDSTAGDIVSSLNTALASSGATASLDSSGHLVISASSSSDGVAVSTLSGSVGGTGLSSYFGLNDLFENGTSAATIAVNPAFASSASSLPTGTLTGTATGDAAVASSDATILTKLTTALSSSQSLSASGYLGAASSTFQNYAATIISDVSTRYTEASDTATTQTATLSSLTDSFSNETGVNTDSETAKLTALQTQYEASAQVVTTVKAMFSALLTAMQS